MHLYGRMPQVSLPLVDGPARVAEASSEVLLTTIDVVTRRIISIRKCKSRSHALAILRNLDEVCDAEIRTPTYSELILSLPQN
jgi:hypothetical protein